MKTNLLIVGCGDLGVRVAQRMSDERGWQVIGLRTNIRTLPPLIEALAADVRNLSQLQMALAKRSFDYVLVTTAARDRSDDGYRELYCTGLANLLTVLHSTGLPKHLLLASSSRIWHQDDGCLLDESSVACPADFAGRRLLEAETLLDSAIIPASVVRFTGIYGPGRNALIRRVIAGKGCRRTPPLYTNRIHSYDAAGFLCHLLRAVADSQPVQKLYLATDSEPAPLWNVMQWLARRLGVPLPTDGGDDDHYRLRFSRRFSNAGMLASGFRLQYPDYRSGYGAMLQMQCPVSAYF